MTRATATPDRTDVSRRTGVPWYLWCGALAVTSAYVGGYWDISWHRSIGRDTFWTAPHMAIYACGVLAGISSAYLILTTTFQKSSPRPARSPGAFPTWPPDATNYSRTWCTQPVWPKPSRPRSISRSFAARHLPATAKAPRRATHASC